MTNLSEMPKRRETDAVEAVVDESREKRSVRGIQTNRKRRLATEEESEQSLNECMIKYHFRTRAVHVRHCRLCCQVWIKLKP